MKMRVWHWRLGLTSGTYLGCSDCLRGSIPERVFESRRKAA
jgi:hypothetical protein